MSLFGLFLTLALVSDGSVQGTAAPRERIVLFLHADDLLRANEVVEAIGACPTIPATAVVSFFDGLKVEQDFTVDADVLRRASAKASVGGERSTADPAGEFSLAAQLPAGSSKSGKTVLGALRVVGKAIAPIGKSTTVVLLSRGIAMGERRAVGELATRPLEHDTALLYGEGPGGGRLVDVEGMDRSFLDARSALASSGAKVIAVNVGDRYSPGLKAIAEATDGRYLQVGKEASAGVALGSALCH